MLGPQCFLQFATSHLLLRLLLHCVYFLRSQIKISSFSEKTDWMSLHPSSCPSVGVQEIHNIFSSHCLSGFGSSRCWLLSRDLHLRDVSFSTDCNEWVHGWKWEWWTQHCSSPQGRSASSLCARLRGCCHLLDAHSQDTSHILNWWYIKHLIKLIHEKWVALFLIKNSNTSNLIITF